MVKRGIVVLLFASVFAGAGAQHLSHKVLAMTGSVASSGGYTISQTIGEPVVEYIHTDFYALTQGFQQPSVIAIDTTGTRGNGVNVYPNPVSETLNLVLFGDRDIEYSVTIFGMNGSIFYRNDYPCHGNYFHTIYIDLRSFRQGTYFVRVVARDGTIARLFKIEKI